jgi:hypothetical protein
MPFASIRKAAISIILSTKGDRPVVSKSTAMMPFGNKLNNRAFSESVRG